MHVINPSAELTLPVLCTMMRGIAGRRVDLEVRRVSDDAIHLHLYHNVHTHSGDE